MTAKTDNGNGPAPTEQDVKTVTKRNIISIGYKLDKAIAKNLPRSTEVEIGDAGHPWYGTKSWIVQFQTKQLKTKKIEDFKKDLGLLYWSKLWDSYERIPHMEKHFSITLTYIGDFVLVQMTIRELAYYEEAEA